MTHKIIHVADQELFRLPEIKNFLRISHDYDDAWLPNILQGSIEAAENFLRLTLLARRVEIRAENIRQSKFILPLRPIAEILEIKAHKGEVVTDIRNYKLSDETIKFSNLPAYDYITIIYNSGYLDQSKIPSAIKQGILLHVAEIYDSHGANAALSDEVRKLYQPHRKMVV
jgi:uncharacterized phiE125 gp8 family phage protein